LAEGCYQKCSGNDFNVEFAQPTVSVMLKEVLAAIERHICPKWIQTQMSEVEKENAKLSFFF